MKTRTTFIMTLAVLVGLAIILLINSLSFFRFGLSLSTYVSHNAVRGSAVQHKGLLYTLNFEQQKELVETINYALPITSAALQQRKSPEDVADLGVEKVLIYRFNEPDVEMHLLGYVPGVTGGTAQAGKTPLSIVFSAPEWNRGEPLEEAHPGGLQQLFSQSFDP